MSEGKRITFADIKRQMELASEDIETWPTWMRRAAGLDGEGPDYNTLRAENARLREALKTAQELLCVPERNQDDEWEDRRRQVDEALQPKEPKP